MPPAPVVATECANAYVCPLDAAKLVALRHIVEGLRQESGGQKSALVFKPRRWRFHAERPTWKSDIRWISAADEQTFRGLFEPLFAKLGIASLFSFLGDMALFSGFFVTRGHTRKTHFHTDFGDTGSRCFTLMTPLYDMADLRDCHLLCQVPTDGEAAACAPVADAPAADVPAACPLADAPVACTVAAAAVAAAASVGARDVIRQYRYELGTAIAFGDGFVHGTETGEAPSQLAFLCFTFGDRRCTPEQWSAAEGYIKEQGPVYQDPTGRLVVKDVA